MALATNNSPSHGRHRVHPGTTNGFLPNQHPHGAQTQTAYHHMNGHIPRPENLYFGRSRTSYDQFHPQIFDQRQYFQTPSPVGRWTPSGTVRSISQSAATTPTEIAYPSNYQGMPYTGNYAEQREHAATLSAGSSLSRHTKMTRAQQHITRTEVVIHALQNGIRSSIASTQKEIRLMRSQMEILSTDSSQGKMFELEKQIKSAERYIKRLEFQTCRIEELHEKFDTQMRLKEGARNLVSAFDRDYGSSKKRGKNSPAPPESLRGDLKDVVAALTAIDSELELFLGTINVEMKGIAGFARIAPGDTFEVCLKHGHQKWKTRGKTVADRTQRWDSERTTLKVHLHEALEIKVSEVKMFGKTSGLADQSCDPIQLFSPDPQLMTMNLNFNGSLKLNLVATWNPIDSSPSSLDSSSPWSFSHGRRGTGSPGNSRKHQSLSPRTGQRPVSVYHNEMYQTPKTATSAQSSSGQNINGQFQSLSKTSWDSRSLSSMQSPRVRPLNDRPLPDSFRQPPPPSLRTGKEGAAPPLLALLRVLKPILQRLQSPHPELNPLQTLVNLWDAFLKRSLMSSLNQDSDASSRSVESAMENMRIDTSDSDDLDNNYLLRNASGNTQDSGFDSFRKRYSAMVQTGEGENQVNRGLMDSPSPKNTPPRRHLGQPFPNGKASPRNIKSKRQEDSVKSSRRKSLGSTLESARGVSPLHSLPPTNSSVTTGQTEVDRCLYHHLRHCEVLLKSLEMLYGPLHYREQEIFHKLDGETAALDDLLNMAKKYTLFPLNIETVLAGLDASGEMRDVWTSVTRGGTGSKLVVPSEVLLEELLKSYSSIVHSKYPDLVQKVFKKVLFLLTDRETWDPETVTVFQFINSLRDKEMSTFIESLAHETWIISSLETGVVGSVQGIMERLKKVPVPPPPDCLRHIGLVLVSPVEELHPPAESYLLHAQGSLREDLVGSFLSFLELEEPDSRRGACRALAVLNARRCIGPLAFVARSDRKGSVREEARKALVSFGQEGRDFLEGGRMGLNGFDHMKL